MAETRQLDGGTEVSFDDGTTLIAPDLVGEIEELSLQESTTRSAGAAQDPALLAAFERQGMQVAKVLEISVQDDRAPVAATGARRSSASPGQTRLGEEAILLQVPAVSPNERAVVMHTDEEGTIRWILPEPRVGGDPATRGSGAKFEFLLPRESAPAPPTANASLTRGRGTQLARRIVRVVTWITDPLLGAGLLPAVQKWEEANRPYGLRAFPFMPGAGEPDWSAMTKGRALCFFHGTFSSCHASYSVLSQDTVDDLERIYDKRIFGFDHPSLHHGPAENTMTFFKMLQERLAPGSALELDVVTHSRGGLVLRSVDQAIRRGENAGLNVKLRRVILVASPNLGTALATADHGLDMVDRYTNLIAWLPDNVFTYLFEGLLTFVKLVYHSAVNTLPGLMSMQPAGSFLGGLNADNAAAAMPEYHAIAANYAPKPGDGLNGILKRVGDKLVDTCFDEENDLVVPTRGGSHRQAAHPWIEPPRVLQLIEADAVHHCSYLGNAKVDRQIVAWLSA